MNKWAKAPMSLKDYAGFAMLFLLGGILNLMIPMYVFAAAGFIGAAYFGVRGFYLLAHPKDLD